MTMRAHLVTEGQATAAAGFLSVMVECMLLFSLFLQCIQLGAAASALGLVMGACALVPYAVQKVSARIEGVLVARIRVVWLGCLLAGIALGLLLVLPLPPSRQLLMLLLCVASALCFLQFQLFETRLSMLCVEGRLQTEQANRFLQVAMTIGSAFGGFLAGHVLDAHGLPGVGWVSVLLLVVCVGCVLRAGDGEGQPPGGTPGGGPAAGAAPPSRAALLAAFVQLLLMCIAPAALNFLLPWIVVQENGWGPAAFGSLDFLAAMGAFIAILLVGRTEAGRLFWSGVGCFVIASACLMSGGSFPHLAVMCLLWGLGMNLIRMHARQIFFLALRTRRDALLWSQRLGLTRCLVEAGVPVVLGLCAATPSGQLFAGVAWALTAAVAAVGLAARVGQRPGVQPALMAKEDPP